MDADSTSTRTVDLSGKLAGWFVLVGVISAISYAGRFAGGKPPKNALYDYSTAVSELIPSETIGRVRIGRSVRM